MDISLTKALPIDLQKKSEEVGIILAKKGIRQAPTLRVGMAVDVSYSMDSMFSASNGRVSAVQNAFNQIMGVSVQFDDNGELDVFQFCTRCDYVGTSKPEAGDYDQFIKNNRIAPRGGTNYAPIVNESIKFFFKKKGGFMGIGGGGGFEDETPVLMLILTDGEPSDRAATMQAMQAATDKPIYFHMVGIGGSRNNFPTIAYLADELPNVGEVYLPRLDMSDAEIYEQIIADELIQFVSKFLTIGRRR